jgi:hypothetical protein
MSEPRHEVVDPSTSAARLFELASSNPELAPWIAVHPNAYPELREWASGIGSVAPAVVTPATPASTPAPSEASAPEISQPAAVVAAAPAVPSDLAAPAPAPAQASIPPAPSDAPDAPAAPVSTAKRLWTTRRRLLIGIAAGVVALLVIAGGGVWWFVSSRLGGAASPTAAVEKLVASAQDVDPVAFYGSFAPSEVGELQTAFQKLADAHPKNGVDTSKVLSELHDALKVTSADMTYRETKIADGVARVTWTSGSMTVSGNETKMADALFSLYEPTLRASLKRAGESTSEIDDSVSNARSSLEKGIHLPQTLDAKDPQQEISVVAVQEGSGWYLSPMLTAADYWARSVQGGSAQIGDAVIPAHTFATPEDAASDLTKAIVRQDTGAMAADLALPERRLFSLYGPVWTRATGRTDSSSGTKLALTDARFSSKIDGDRAALTIKDVTVSSTQWNSDVGQSLRTTYSLTGVCVTYKGQTAYDNGTWDLYDGYQPDWQVRADSGGGCLSDNSTLRKLGVQDMSIQAVKENGGWLVSPIATVGDAFGIATANYLKYQDEGRVGDLFG